MKVSWGDKDDGYSLTELMVVVALLGVVLGAAYLLLGAVSTMANHLEARIVAADENRAVLDRLTREIRQAYEVVDGEGAFADATATQCSFYTDLDHDRIPEIVRYRVDGRKLYRSVAAADSVFPPYDFGEFSEETAVIESLDDSWVGSMFTYYDHEDPAEEVSSGNEEEVSAVEVQLVNSATVRDYTVVIDQTTWIKVRAFRSTID